MEQTLVLGDCQETGSLERTQWRGKDSRGRVVVKNPREQRHALKESQTVRLLKRQMGEGDREGEGRGRHKDRLRASISYRPLTGTVSVKWFGKKPGQAESRDE